jgi:hypothetical protein
MDDEVEKIMEKMKTEKMNEVLDFQKKNEKK